MFKKIITVISSLALGAIALTGCTSSTSQVQNIKVAEVTHSVFYAPQYVAMSQGFFEEEGLKVDLINTAGADKTMAALLSGEVQIGLMGPEASIYVYNQGNDDYAVNFAQLTQKDGSFLVSREKTDNFKWSDLKGKEVLAGRKGGVPNMTLEYVAKQNGLVLGEDTANGQSNFRTDIQFNVMSGAFVGGEGDYVALFDPAATALEKEGKGYIVASIGEESGLIPYTAYSAPISYIEENQETIQKFTNAVYKGQLWVQEHSAEEIAKAIQPYFTDLDSADLVTVVNRYKSIDAWAHTPVLTEDSLNRLMDVMQEAKELDTRTPFDKIVNNDFANQAINNVK